MNLGDMTQESHWTNANKATLANFVNVCERGGMPIQTFHAIGNHDHDMAVQNIAGDDDSAAELAYISALGPTYYAVNIGKVHYVVFDNTQYVNTAATGHSPSASTGVRWTGRRRTPTTCRRTSSAS